MFIYQREEKTVSNSIVEAVRDELRQIGAVRNEAEFCRDWLGRGESYLRTLRFTGRQPSAAALLFCADRLQRLALHLSSNSVANGAYWAERFALLARDCRAEMERNALVRCPIPQNRVLQNQTGKYLSNHGGTVATPHRRGAERCV
ncbi:DUF6626 family protein [Thioclava sp. A2]|uniref:DUF6626 family protein n=1 Tax=Thioclava sp. FCG-A2 TaxID=3080562 RepID=UPI003988128C